MNETTINNGWANVEVRDGGGWSVTGKENVMGIRDLFSYTAALYKIMTHRNVSGVVLALEFQTWALDQNYIDPVKMDRTICSEIQHGRITSDVVSKGKNKGENRLTLTPAGKSFGKGQQLTGQTKLISRRMARIRMEYQSDGTREPRLYRIS